jgi:polysaccharide pyruvyl transferase WcaK-like protein
MKGRIAVLGWYDKGNIGDESYKLSFPTLFPDYDFHFTDDLRRAPQCDWVIMGGGNVIDASFFDQLENVKVPKLLLSVGVPTREDRRRPHMHLLDKFQQFEAICVRDYMSFDLLHNKGIEVSYMPDFSFVLHPNKVRGRELLKKMYRQVHGELYERTVVVVLNSFLAAGNELLARDFLTFQKVCFDIAKCADNTNASFIFLPFGGDQFTNDRMANGWAAGRCKWYRKNLVIYDWLTVQDTLDVMAACDVAISSRLHASIFSTISGVPFVDITHHDKNKVFMESIGKEEWSLDYWYLDYHCMYEMVNAFLSEAAAADRRDLLIMSSINRHSLLRNVPKFLQAKNPEVTPVKEEKTG